METRRDQMLDPYRAMLEAWKVRDADGFAAAFMADGSSVGFDGSPMNGQEEIAAFHGRPHLVDEMTTELMEAMRRGHIVF